MHLTFSIGIPAFKEKYLFECIESILGQSFLDFEIIIVNDASPQNIQGVVRQFDDERIKYYENETNFGAVEVVKNWNKCLSFARGDFFVLMGDDDKMMPGYLQEFSELIRLYPEQNVYHCRSFIINEKSEIVELTPSWPEKENVYDNIWHRMKGFRLQYISDFMYKTNWLQENNGFFDLPLAWGSDEVTSYLAMGKKCIIHTNKPLLMYRRHSQSITNSKNHEYKMEAVLKLDLWLKHFLDHEPDNFLLRVAYNNVCTERKKFIRKKKIATISGAIGAMNFYSIVKWCLKRNTYSLNLGDIFYAIIMFLKAKIVVYSFAKK